jgi:hypothetical protein
MCLVPSDSSSGQQLIGGWLVSDVPSAVRKGPAGPIDLAEGMQRWNAEGCVLKVSTLHLWEFVLTMNCFFQIRTEDTDCPIWKPSPSFRTPCRSSLPWYDKYAYKYE